MGTHTLEEKLNATLRTVLCPNLILPFTPFIHLDALWRPKNPDPQVSIAEIRGKAA